MATIKIKLHKRDYYALNKIGIPLYELEKNLKTDEVIVEIDKKDIGFLKANDYVFEIVED